MFSKLAFQLGVVGLATMLMQAVQPPPMPCAVNHDGCVQKVELVFEKGCIESLAPAAGFQIHVEVDPVTGQADFKQPVRTTGEVMYRLHRSCAMRNIYWVKK